MCKAPAESWPKAPADPATQPAARCLEPIDFINRKHRINRLALGVPAGSMPLTATRHERIDPMSTSKLTSASGIPIADNQNSLSAGRRGPLLLQDFHLIEKLQH